MLTTYLYKKGKPLQENLSRADMFSALKDKDALLWVDLEAPSEFESDTLVEIFNFHPLAVEDCVMDHSQPKADDYDEYLFLVMHAAAMRQKEDGDGEELCTIELNIFLGKNYVVTFHKTPMKTVQQVRESARRKPEAYMGGGSDMLVHALLDHLVDNYQPVLDKYDDRIDQMEDEIFNNPSANYLSKIMQTKRDIFNLRRIISPQRDTINNLTRTPTSFIDSENKIYFRDIYDHLFRIYGIVEGFHETLTSVLQVYFSYSSHKLNDAIKRMTVLATLTMPALIVASIYGMNFHNMPELDWQYGYFFSFGLMFTMSVGMLVFMKIKKWI